MNPINRDDPRPQHVQIASELRAAIKTGTYEAGDRLPSQPQLAADYGVARETVKRALDILRDERLIVSRQGSGSFVRSAAASPTELRPRVSIAFTEADHVTLDFAGFSSETLYNAMIEPLDQIRHGHAQPSSIRLRLLISDMTQPLPWPSRVGDDGVPLDDHEVRGRMARITDRSVHALADTVHELEQLGLVRTASIEVRTVPVPPLAKVYLINGTTLYFGWYDLGQRKVTIRNQEVPIFDTLGKDSTLYPFESSDDDGAQFIGQTQRWFDSLWDQIARPYEW